MNPLLIILSITGVFALSFGVVMYFMRASRMEATLQRQLEHISENYGKGPLATNILKEERLSPSPQVHQLLMQTPVAIPLLRLIRQAGLDWWVSSVIGYSLALAGVAGLLGGLFTRNLLMAVVIGALAGLAPTGVLKFLRGRRFGACTRLLPDAVDLMSRALRAGHALNAALEMVSTDIAEPLASEFRVVYEEQTFGLPLRDALENLLQRIPNADLEFLVAALLLQKDTGGNLAQILDKTSMLMRDRVRLRGQIRTITAQARASGWILAALPFVMYFLMDLINPGYESILLNDPIGIKLIYVGFVMLAIGSMVIRKIVDIRI